MGNFQAASFSRFLFPDRKTYQLGTISLAIFRNTFTCTTVQIFVDFLQTFPSVSLKNLKILGFFLSPVKGFLAVGGW